MKVYLYELSDEPKHLHFTETDSWVTELVKSTQESDLSAEKPKSTLPKGATSEPVKNSSIQSTKFTPHYTVDMELRQLQDVVFLKGKLDLNIGLLCSRCANGFEHHLISNFQSMFTRERTLGEQTSNVGVAHSEPTGATGEDLDIEFLEKDYIELADVLKEQIYLKIPFQPLCSEGCKGICPVCGQDQNTQPCQCHRIKNPALANALKNFRF
jgi:uncharacterized protein